MEFTYIQKSEDSDKVYYPKKFFVSLQGFVPIPCLSHLWTKEKQEEFKLAVGSAYSFVTTTVGTEWELWPIRCTFRKNQDEYTIRYKDQKIKLLDFAWPGFRDDVVMKEIFLQRFSSDRTSSSIQFELTDVLLYKFLMKFQDSLIFSFPFGSDMRKLDYYVDEPIIDLINMKPITLRHLKHDESLNFIICANDFVNLLNSSIVSVRERK